MNKKQKFCLFIGTLIFDIAGFAFLYVNLISRYRMAADEKYQFFLTWEPADKRLLLLLIAVTTVSLFYILTDDKTKKMQKYKEHHIGMHGDRRHADSKTSHSAPPATDQRRTKS